MFFVFGPDKICPPHDDPWCMSSFSHGAFSNVCLSYLPFPDMIRPAPHRHWTRTSSTATRPCPRGHLKLHWPRTRLSPRSATSDPNSIKDTWSKGRPLWRRSPRRSCNPTRRRFPSRPQTIRSTARCSNTHNRSCHIQDWWPVTTPPLTNPSTCRRPRPRHLPPQPKPKPPTFPSSRLPPRKPQLRAAAALRPKNQLKASAILFPPFPCSRKWSLYLFSSFFL